MTMGDFKRLEERYRLGKCTPEELDFIERWLKINGNIGEDCRIFETEEEAEKIKNEIWTRIEMASGLSAGELRPKKPQRRYFIFSAAACIVLVVTGFYFGRTLDQSELPVEGGVVTTQYAKEHNQRILMSDSTVIVLGKDSRIITDDQYGKKTRTVKLIGEAFFDVRHDPKVPFIVYSGDLVTEVLGTSFRIKPEVGKKTIEVSVASGKVSVYSGEKDQKQRRKGVVILPNQKAIFNTDSKLIREDLVDVPKRLDKESPEYNFNFDEVALEQVVSVLQHCYRIEIVVSNPDLKGCIFTGNLNGFDLFKQLNYLCDVVDAQYEVRGTTIFLTGKGCRASI